MWLIDFMHDFQLNRNTIRPIFGVWLSLIRCSTAVTHFSFSRWANSTFMLCLRVKQHFYPNHPSCLSLSLNIHRRNSSRLVFFSSLFVLFIKSLSTIMNSSERPSAHLLIVASSLWRNSVRVLLEHTEKHSPSPAHCLFSFITRALQFRVDKPLLVYTSDLGSAYPIAS